jgi:hypothetical protein
MQSASEWGHKGSSRSGSSAAEARLNTSGRKRNLRENGGGSGGREESVGSLRAVHRSAGQTSNSVISENCVGQTGTTTTKTRSRSGKRCE